VALEGLGGNFVSSTDHYATAMHLLARKNYDTREATPEEVAQAQVHATLALVNVAGRLLAELAKIREHISGA